MKTILVLLATTALMVAILAMPASAAPIFTGGLVNVTIADSMDNEDVTVQVPVAAAVNICDTNFITDNDGNIICCTAKVDSRANR